LAVLDAGAAFGPRAPEQSELHVALPWTAFLILEIMLRVRLA
jgi:hypothetical protein